MIVIWIAAIVVFGIVEAVTVGLVSPRFVRAAAVCWRRCWGRPCGCRSSCSSW